MTTMLAAHGRHTGLRKVAILIASLGQEAASEVMKYLTEDEVEKVAREIATLGMVASEESEKVLEEFHTLSLAAGYMTTGGVDYARELLLKSMDPDHARRLIDRVLRSFESTVGFTAIEKADPQQLSKFILSEHPQTIALILAHLNATSAAQMITLLPDGLRPDVLQRMARLDEISPDVIRRISAVIEQRLKALGAGSSHEAYGGVRAVAELLNRLDRAIAQPVLDTIEGEQPELAVSIRNLMFVFDDLVSVDNNGLREIVQRADKKSLCIALKGATEEIRAKFFQNMSKRAGEMLREEMEVLGAIRLRDVEKAQHEVVAIARKLEEEGLIVTGAAAGEPYVV